MNKKLYKLLIAITCLTITISCVNNSTKKNNQKSTKLDTVVSLRDEKIGLKIDSSIYSFKKTKEKNLLKVPKFNDTIKLLLDYYVGMSKQEYRNKSLSLVDDNILIGKDGTAGFDGLIEEGNPFRTIKNASFSLILPWYFNGPNGKTPEEAKLYPFFKNGKLKEISLFCKSIDELPFMPMLVKNYGKPIIKGYDFCTSR